MTNLLDITTFARASNATYTDATGTLQTVAANVPRIGHHVWDGSQWVNQGLLLESEARANLITYSEDFTDASWVKTRATITANALTAPSGSTTADKLVEDSSTSTTHFVRSSFSCVSGTSYTFSVFLKESERQWVGLQFSSEFTGATAVNASFDLSSGTVGNVDAAITAGIENFGNGWFRCYITATAGATAAATYNAFLADDDDSFVYTGDGASGVYIWGAQLEAGSTPSSYIPTAGATATRAAETLTIPAANLPYPEPVVIGEELVTNGTFDTGDLTGFTDTSEGTGSASINGSNQLELVNGGDSSNEGKVYTIVPTVTGKVYFFSIDISNATSLVQIGTAADVGNIHQTAETTGTLTYIFTALSTTTYLSIRNFGGGGTSIIDNISVKEINPLAVSIAMEGTMTYADNDLSTEETLYRWQADANNNINAWVRTDTAPNKILFWVIESGNPVLVDGGSLSPGVNVPFSIASRHGSTFINGAVDGTALTENTTPVALPDLSTTDLQLGYDFMGTIKTFRIWGADIGDTGISEASQ